MAIQRISRGYPFPIYICETDNKQRIGRGIYIVETVSAGGSTVSLASRIACRTGLTLATTVVTNLVGNIKDSLVTQAITTQATALSANIIAQCKTQLSGAYTSALSTKIVAQCKTKISGAYAVGVAAKTAFMSEGRGVVVFITALFASATMQSAARAITTRVSGLQGLLRFDTRTKITGGSFPVGIAVKAAFLSKGAGTIAFLVSLFASTAMQSRVKGITTRVTALQGLVRVSSRLKLSGGTFTAGMLVKATFAAVLNAVLQFSGGAIVTVYATTYVARSPIGMYCARAVDKYIVQSHIGRYVARGGRGK